MVRAENKIIGGKKRERDYLRRFKVIFVAWERCGPQYFLSCKESAVNSQAL